MGSLYEDVIGVQLPRLSHIPPAEIGSAGDAAIKLAYVAGLDLDEWQQWVVRHALGTKEETYFNDVLQKEMHMSSAYEIALIVARQNGKGSVMEALELAWLFLLGARTICHSAHEFATSKEHFQRIEGLISQTPELKGELARGGIKWSHGDESVTRANGQRLIFKTRTKGAARGFSIDKLVMDEAMILASQMVGAMLPTTASRPDVQIMYAGSAGDRDSEHFGKARARGIKGNDPRLFFSEWSANGHSQLCESDCEEHDDRTSPLSWAKANPGLGIRLRVDNVQSELVGMDEDVFNQERLSIGDWPATEEPWRVIDKPAWTARQTKELAPGKPFVFAVDVTPDLKWSCITVAGATSDGGIGIEVTGDGEALREKDRTDHRAGVKWVVPRIKELANNHKGSVFVINKALPAGMFALELEEVLGAKRILYPTTREYQQACGEFYSAVVPRGTGNPYLWHIGQPDLNTAVANAEKRISADLWAWDTRSKTDDISPLVAATHALWGLKHLQNKPKPKPMFAFV